MEIEETFIIQKSGITPDINAKNDRWDAILYFIRQTLHDHAAILPSVMTFETEADPSQRWTVDQLDGKQDVFKNQVGWTVTIERDRIKVDFKGDSSNLKAPSSMVRFYMPTENDRSVRLLFYNDFAHLLVRAETVNDTGTKLLMMVAQRVPNFQGMP